MNEKKPEIVSSTKARQNLGDLVDRVRIAQDEFIIERDGKQVAMLVPIKTDASAAPVSPGRLDFRNSAGICQDLWRREQVSKPEISEVRLKEELKLSFKQGDSIFIDADPIIYYWSRDEVYFGIMEEIFNKVYENNVQCFFSPLTLMRSILYQIEKNEFSLAKKCSTYLCESTNFNFRKTDEAESSLIARVKSSYDKLSFDEAMQVGSSISIGADYLLSNNPIYKSLPKTIVACPINIIILEDLINTQS